MSMAMILLRAGESGNVTSALALQQDAHGKRALAGGNASNELRARHVLKSYESEGKDIGARRLWTASHWAVSQDTDLSYEPRVSNGCEKSLFGQP